MATPAWQVNGQYYETCSCDFVCPCLPGQMVVTPSKASCTFAMAFQIERGRFGAVSLDGLGFIVLGLTPEAMGKGNWSVGLVADERASVEQRDCSGLRDARCARLFRGNALHSTGLGRSAARAARVEE